MILTREINIRINQSNFQYFEDLGYDVYVGEEITIPIELLTTGSQYKITCECDGCGCVKSVIYKNYIKYGNEFGYYYCRKCSEPKRKRSLRLSYGCDYPIQNKKIYSKIKENLN